MATTGRLVRDGSVLALLEIATSRREKRRGLLGRDGVAGALLLEGGRSVHTFGMRFPIDVAFCDREGVVVKTRTLPPGRITWPVLASRSIVEAEAGAFQSWGLRPGDVVGFER